MFEGRGDSTPGACKGWHGVGIVAWDLHVCIKSVKNITGTVVVLLLIPHGDQASITQKVAQVMLLHVGRPLQIQTMDALSCGPRPRVDEG